MIFDILEIHKDSQILALFLKLQSYAKYLMILMIVNMRMQDGRSTIVPIIYEQLSQGRMANRPAFIASKSFEL